MAQLSDTQFQALLATLTQSAATQLSEAAKSATAEALAAAKPKNEIRQKNDPSALGPMRQCALGSDKMRKFTLFEDWLEEAENRMEYIGTSTDKEKIILLKTWGGTEIKDLIKTQSSVANTANLKQTKSPLNSSADSEEDTIPALEVDDNSSYKVLIESIRAHLRKMVNRTMAMHQLNSTKQGTRPWNDFVKDLETKARALNFENKPYTTEEAIKDAAIFGMNDRQMMEKALAEDPNIDELTRWCQARESGKEDAANLKNTSSVKKTSPTDHQIDEMMETLKVMKMKKAGKFSNRNRKSNPCQRCKSQAHEPNRCPSNGKTCFTCGGSNHFSGSEACPKTSQLKRLETEGDDSYAQTRMHNEPQQHTSFRYPIYDEDSMVTKTAKRIVTICKVAEEDQKWVEVSIGGVQCKLFADTGSEFTIIPPEIYKPEMGRVFKPDINLRAWGSQGNLNIIGMLKPEVETKLGARTKTKVYIVEGFKPEPLLGDTDAQALGFIRFNKDGRLPSQRETLTIRVVEKTEPSIPQQIRDNLKVEVDTKPDANNLENLSPDGQRQIEELVDHYKGSVFDDTRVGLMNIPPIHLDYDAGHTPVQPQFRNIPFHYRDRVSKHLQFLREQGVISDVDPRESYKCVMNCVITDKSGDEIRMNIDNTPQNPGLNRTKFHVQTPQEIRHELKEAKIFSEMDMGWAYHQMPIDEETKSQAIFQSHEGLHRMERLYFGPTASSGIFHNEVRKAFADIKGVTNLHDNILVYGHDESDHLRCLQNALKRCKEMGISLKLSKSTFGMPRIKWFGRVFTSNGVTADPGKVEKIIEAGRPQSIEEIRSFLMACQYNAKFAFDNHDLGSYEEVTKPLRLMLKKDSVFRWGKQEENSYRKLIAIINNPSTLQPYNPELATHFMADSSQTGIQASIYQELPGKGKPVWVPVDHVSRAVTETEERYSPIERESLGISWGMEQFRHYLVGNDFTAWTDHEPLPSIYNNPQKIASKRISKHRDAVQDLKFKLRYLKGEKMPCDYGSRHPNPIEHLTVEEREVLGFDMGKDIYVRRIFNIDQSPTYITSEQIKKAATLDTRYGEAVTGIRKGHSKPPEDSPFKNIWGELTEIDGILYRADNMVIPDAPERPGTTNLRTKILDIAHEGHPGQTAMKRFVRAHVWFPGLDSAVGDIVRGCLPCQASTETKHRDPLIPSIPPAKPWENLAADHWGPTGDGLHLLAVIDETTKYPEVAIVKGTSAEANIEAFDNIFSRHGFCNILKTDGGPPFNGNENHLLQRYFKWAGIVHKKTHSAEDPEANGLAESFMKHLKKIWHTAIIEGNNPRAEINKHLLMFRATPHPSTGFSPAQLLFDRKIKTRLPDTKFYPNSQIEEACRNDMEAKAIQKRYKDAKNYVKHHAIELGDQVILKQQQSKINPPFDPAPYKVIQIRGHQITGQRNEEVRTRDAQKWKVVHPRTKPNYEGEQLATDNLSAEQLWTEPSTSTQSATGQGTAGPPAATESSLTAEERPSVSEEQSAMQLSDDQPLAEQTPAAQAAAAVGQASAAAEASTGAQMSTSRRELRGRGRGRPPKARRWNFQCKRR